jgi:hypothetical protein
VEPTRSQNITLSGRRSAFAVEDTLLSRTRLGIQSLPTIFTRGAVGSRSAANRSEQKTTMTNHRDTEVFEILRRQLRQHLGVDPVVAECRLVSFKTERS